MDSCRKVYKRRTMNDLDDGEVLDEAEQSKVIEDLTAQAAGLSSSTRKMFMGLLITIASLFICCFFHSIVDDPWRLEHQRHFKEIVPHWLFPVYYIASSFCFAVAAAVVQDRPPSLPVTICRYLAVFIAVVVLLGWGQIFYTHSVSNPLLGWIPIVDLAGLALAYYIHLDTKGIVISVDNLQNFKYSHKSA